MFTGLITDVGKIVSVAPLGAPAVHGQLADQRMVLATAYDMSQVDIGASIACNGICLTVVSKAEGQFAVDVSGETLSVTTARDWREGTLVNLEQSLRLGDEMGGHIVSGHVDCIATVTTWEAVADSMLLQIDVPSRYAALVAAKGSVTIDGVSLTINRVADDGDTSRIDINVIPHTQEKTAFKSLLAGDIVNIEFDMLARYVARLAEVKDRQHG